VCVSIGMVIIKKAFNAQSGSQTRIVLLLLDGLVFGTFFCLLRVLEGLSDAGYLTLLTDDPLGPQYMKKESQLVKIRSSKRTVLEEIPIARDGVESPVVQEELDLGEQKNSNDDLDAELFTELDFDLETQTEFHVKKVKVFLRTIDVITWYSFVSFRMLMYCIPVGFWLINSYWYLAVAVLLFAFLFHLDRLEKDAIFSEDFENGDDL
jgi:hypothetical protein